MLIFYNVDILQYYLEHSSAHITTNRSLASGPMPTCFYKMNLARILNPSCDKIKFCVSILNVLKSFALSAAQLLSIYNSESLQGRQWS